MHWTMLLLLLLAARAVAQAPLPILFVHGLDSDDRSFGELMEFLTADLSGPDWGEGINVFDVVLNADNDDNNANLLDDVRWDDFQSGSRWINVGRRSFAWEIEDAVDGWVPSDIFAVNFAEERIRGAGGFWNDYFDFSNAAAVSKQAYALSHVIQEVLDETAAPAIILVGHSMGGLAIREYLQRREDGLPRWWVEPQQPQGHCVAAVLTVGTPHLGSNFVNVGRTAEEEAQREVFPPNTSTDAVRDLRYGYLPVGWAPDPVQDNGVYLFGGSEPWLATLDMLDSTLSYHTHDINCDGDEEDLIVGINSPLDASRDNPEMPLPDDVAYTFLTATWIDWLGDGDGVVRRDRQFLVDRGDTLLMTGVFHTSETGRVSEVLRGLDEPDEPQFAYPLSLPFSCQGFLSTQMNQSVLDRDYFRVTLSYPGELVLVLADRLAGTQSFALLADSLIEERIVMDSPIVIQCHLDAGDYLIRVEGDGSQAPWNAAYRISGSFDPDPPEAPQLMVQALADSTLRISWTPVPLVSGYALYQLVEPWQHVSPQSLVLHAGADVLSCTMPMPEENAALFYRVCAVRN